MTGSLCPLPAQAYFDWLSHPMSGVEEVDEVQLQAGLRGRGLDPQVRLFFAGEATHKEDAYTVQGAMLSGGCGCCCC